MAIAKLNVGGTWKNTLYSSSTTCSCSTGCNTTCKNSCNTSCGTNCGTSCTGYCNVGCEGSSRSGGLWTYCGTSCNSICIGSCSGDNTVSIYNGSTTTYYRKLKVNSNGTWKANKNFRLKVGSTWKSVP